MAMYTDINKDCVMIEDRNGFTVEFYDADAFDGGGHSFPVGTGGTFAEALESAMNFLTRGKDRADAEVHADRLRARFIKRGCNPTGLWR